MAKNEGAETTPGTFDPLIGERIGDYQILRVIGSGGMGTVYLAQDAILGRFVAVKILREELRSQPEIVKRFHKEAQAASSISHPNVVKVIQFGQVGEGGVLFLVTEYLEGQSLAEIIAREWPIHPQRIARIMDQTLGALAAAHRQNVIHRDLKPENIFVLQREGQPDFVVLLDFGIARVLDPIAEISGGPNLTREGTVLGTPDYMSPEQVMGLAVDQRTDIYAAGAILYEMLAGCTPFAARTQTQTMTGHLDGELIPPRSVNGVRLAKLLAERDQLQVDIEAAQNDTCVAALKGQMAAVVKDIDCANSRLMRCLDIEPGIERVAMTALSRSPARRFASALVMRAALDEAIPLDASYYRASQLPPPSVSSPQGLLGEAPPEDGAGTGRTAPTPAERAALGKAKTITPAALQGDASVAKATIAPATVVAPAPPKPKRRWSTLIAALGVGLVAALVSVPLFESFRLSGEETPAEKAAATAPLAPSQTEAARPKDAPAAQETTRERSASAAEEAAPEASEATAEAEAPALNATSAAPAEVSAPLAEVPPPLPVSPDEEAALGARIADSLKKRDLLKAREACQTYLRLYRGGGYTPFCESFSGQGGRPRKQP